MKRKLFSARNIALMGVLMALVVILQSIALVTSIFLPTSLSFVLIPIVLGAVIIGPLAGGVLGFLFGIIVIIFGVAGLDQFTSMLLANEPWLTVLTCLLKGIAAGVVPGLLYKLIAKKNRYAALVVASLSAPVMNTGIFILGAMTMWGFFSGLAAQSSQSVIYFIIVTCAAINFAIEFASTAVAAPSIYRVTEVVLKKKGRHMSDAVYKEPADTEQTEQISPKTEKVS